jgi:hypothetical protein
VCGRTRRECAGWGWIMRRKSADDFNEYSSYNGLKCLNTKINGEQIISVQFLTGAKEPAVKQISHT